MMKILRFVRALLSVSVGAGGIWAGLTQRPEVKGQENYAMGIGAVLVLFGLWRMSKAFQDDKK